MKNILKFSKILFVLALFSFSMLTLAQWQPPTTSAPGNNATPPINVGPNDQVKVGGGIFAKVLGANKGYFLCGQILGTTVPCVGGNVFSAVRGFSFGLVGIVVDDAGSLIVYDGSNTNTDGKVLTSDATGHATWQDPSGLPAGDSNYTLRFDAPTASWVKSANLQNNDTQVFVGGIPTVTGTGDIVFTSNGKVRITDGTEAAGKVLTAMDSTGKAEWRNVGGLPAGSLNQTLRHDGTNWVANNLLLSDGSRTYVNGVPNPLVPVAGAMLTVNGRIRIDDDTAGIGKVLTATDSLGNATWQAPSSIPDGTDHNQVLTWDNNAQEWSGILYGVPNGTSGQTLFHNGQRWLTSSLLKNNGGHIIISNGNNSDQVLHIGGRIIINDDTKGPGKLLQSDQNGEATWTNFSDTIVYVSKTIASGDTSTPPLAVCPSNHVLIGGGGRCVTGGMTGSAPDPTYQINGKYTVWRVSCPASAVKEVYAICSR